MLHDAFFKFQTKPRLTKLGDVYYEGKEFEVALREKRPGDVSEELKKALGMTDGGPPPWLVNMQRYGPPPSYALPPSHALATPLPLPRHTPPFASPHPSLSLAAARRRRP